VTIANVTALIEQAKRRSSHFRETGRLLPRDWGDATFSWRPSTARRRPASTPRRERPVSPLIQQLITNAICRQHKPSLRAARRLDGYLGGQLFTHDEASVANAIAHHHRLALAFRPPLAVLGNQKLNDINRTRRLKQTLEKHGPKGAIKLVRSFAVLCRMVPVR